DADDQDQYSQPGHTHSAASSTDIPQDQGSEQLAQNLASVLSASDDDVPDNVFEAAKQLLGSQPVNSYDENVHMPIAMDPDLNPTVGNALMNKVLGNSGKIRASLQGLVQSSRYDRPVNKRSGNRIDGRKLSRLVQGDSRVFERRNHKQAPNTAIHLLVDGSTSMADRAPNNPNHSLIELAMESAMALALALEGISGVNPAVTRFPYLGTNNVVPLLKHSQKVRLNAPKFAPIVSGGTPLHTALWYAASSVLATREERKVIMVLTDGQPDDLDFTRAIIKRCVATGIELVGVGICFDTSHLFDRSICISDVSELRSEMFRISRDLLLAA
ncbi:MAG: VWA domain-containing protein, partial [Methyloglobulus sp.]|nr:VWA domain-containing protein [Methyloglobulus sp.]